MQLEFLNLVMEKFKGIIMSLLIESEFILPEYFQYSSHHLSFGMMRDFRHCISMAIKDFCDNLTIDTPKEN